MPAQRMRPDIAGCAAREPRTREKPRASIGCASPAVGAVNFSVSFGQGKLDSARLHRTIVFTRVVDLGRRYHE